MRHDKINHSCYNFHTQDVKVSGLIGSLNKDSHNCGKYHSHGVNMSELFTTSDSLRQN